MELKIRLSEFLREKYYNEMVKASREEMGALVIDFNDIDRFDTMIADQLLEDPTTVLQAFQEALETMDISEGSKINVRVRNLPISKNIRIRNLRTKHIGKFITIEAIVKSASEVKPQVYEAVFKCPECGKDIVVPQETNIIQRPFACECGRRGDFEMTEKRMYDMRWITGVEPYEITTGEQPGEIAIFLKEDLTTPRMQKKTDPGARLVITGMLREMPRRIKGRLSTKMDTYIDANHAEPSAIEYEEIDITPKEEELIKEMAKDPHIYERLRDSIAPGIWGYEEIKEAIVMQMFGGVVHVMPDGTRVRGNIHILITGDPSVGKSQILKLVSGVIPRGRYVSGKGVTGAGLTASVRKDEVIGTWILEAGALILCNKGLISIDEFDKITKDDQIAMHEAMSLETVSIAKASIIATLPAETAVLAGANPKHGRFDPFMSIIEQIQIPETLMSRFDLKFALMDKPDRIKDEKLADHIIMSRLTPEKIEPPINANFLRKYIATARKINKITLSQEASNALKNFYIDMRNRYAGEDTTTISITLRQYEAMIRIAEASAKIRLDDTATMEDADRAIRLMKYSLMQLGYDYETGRIDIDKMESGVTASARKKIGTVIEIINTLQKESKEIAIEDVKAEAESRGVENIDEILERLKREGTIFEPRSGFIRKV